MAPRRVMLVHCGCTRFCGGRPHSAAVPMPRLLLRSRLLCGRPGVMVLCLCIVNATWILRQPIASAYRVSLALAPALCQGRPVSTRCPPASLPSAPVSTPFASISAGFCAAFPRERSTPFVLAALLWPQGAALQLHGAPCLESLCPDRASQSGLKACGPNPAAAAAVQALGLLPPDAPGPGGAAALRAQALPEARLALPRTEDGCGTGI